MNHRVKIANPQEIIELPFDAIRAAAKAVLEGEKVADAKLSVAFVDNPTIHRLNKQFLNHDEPTDVLSFPLSAPNAKTLEGELVIGVEVAKEAAAERGHDISIELQLYVIHGTLHLCGYDDTTPKATEEMRGRERHYLALLGLPAII